MLNRSLHRLLAALKSTDQERGPQQREDSEKQAHVNNPFSSRGKALGCNLMEDTWAGEVGNVGKPAGVQGASKNIHQPREKRAGHGHLHVNRGVENCRETSGDSRVG